MEIEGWSGEEHLGHWVRLCVTEGWDWIGVLLIWVIRFVSVESWKKLGFGLCMSL